MPTACHADPSDGAPVLRLQDIVLFTDSFDSYVFSDPEEIVDKFLSFEAPMIVSAEVNMWPNPHLAEFMPPSASTGHYPFPNSGGYMGFLDYILELYTETIRIQAKSDCVDDQGELIKAVARNHSAFVIDHQAVIFQTLFGKAKSDLEVLPPLPRDTPGSNVTFPGTCLNGHDSLLVCTPTPER